VESKILSFLAMHKDLQDEKDENLFNRISMDKNFHNISPEERDIGMRLIHTLKGKSQALIVKLLDMEGK